MNYSLLTNERIKFCFNYLKITRGEMGLVEMDRFSGNNHYITILMDDGTNVGLIVKGKYDYDVFCNEIIEIL